MHRDIIVMGASAGGVEALSTAVSGLPGDLDATVFVVLHLVPTSTSLLPNVLQRQTSLAVGSAVHGEAIEKGRIYVAPPDHHLLVHRGTVHLSRGPKENGHRPAVDTLFRSAARAYGPRVVGAVLSGTLDDGAVGLRTITARGGAGVVQDPADAAFPGMPASALAAVPGAVRAPAGRLGAIIAEMCRSSAQVGGAETMADETSTGKEDKNSDAWQPINEENAEPSDFTCPECHGTLFRVREGESVDRFRCRVGHGFSSDSLLAGQSEALEAALWSALRALEEGNDLMRRLAARSRKQGLHGVADRFEARLGDGDRNVDLLRQVLLSGETARDETA